MLLRCPAAFGAGGLELGLNLIPEVFVYDRRMRAGERLVFVTDQATVDGSDERGGAVLGWSHDGLPPR